jgi:SAM-dependent methyltransferase
VSGGYGTDLAFVHDVGFGGFARGAAPWILARLRRRGVRAGRIVDLGCGSGIWAAELCRAGYDVLGVDLSAAMIALARRRAPRATFRRGSLLTTRLPPCDAVTALGECVCYAFDARAGTRALPVLFRRIHGVLRPAGLFVFDVATPGRGAGPPVRWHAGDGWVVIARVSEDAAKRILTRRITTFRRRGRAWRRSDEVHRLRLYRPADVLRALARAGFRARAFRGYGRVRLPRGWVGFVGVALGAGRAGRSAASTAETPTLTAEAGRTPARPRRTPSAPPSRRSARRRRTVSSAVR